MSLKDVSVICAAQPNVVETLEKYLEQAKAGKVRSVAVAVEYHDGVTNHEAAFGDYGNRAAIVGRLQVMANHVILNELLEWRPA